DHCQHRSQNGEVEGDLEKRQDTQSQDGVVSQGSDRTYTELPLEAKSQIQEDATQSQEHRQATLIAQLLTHLRADELDALDLETDIRIDLAQRLSYLRTQLRIIFGHAHQHIGDRTEALHHRIGITGLIQLTLDQLQIRCFFILQLDQGSAGKIEPKVQTFGNQRAQTDKGQYQGNGERNIADRHERYGFLDHGHSSDPQFLDVATTEDQVDLSTGKQDRSEHRGENAQRQGDSEALDRPGTQGEENATYQQSRQVTVDDRRVGTVKTFVYGPLH